MIRQFLFAMLIASVLSAQVSQLDRAWQLAGNGQRREAVEVLRQLIKSDPRNADARLLLGSLLVEQGEKAESIDQLREAVRLRPGSAEAENALGEAYKRFGEMEQARTAFQQAAALNPKYGIAQLNLGQILLAAGETEAAAKHLDKAIGLLGRTDDAAEALYLRAKIYTAGGDAKQAAAQLERAVQIRPNFAEAWSDLGQARRTLTDDAGALAAFKRATELNPNGAIAQYRLGAEYLRQQQPRLAVVHLQKASELAPTDQSTLNSLQMALRQDGRPEEADAAKRKLADLLRERDEANQNHLNGIRLNNEGAALQQSGDLRGALQKYQEASQLYPEHAGIRVNYAVALLRLGQWTAGLEELHTALLRDPDNAQIKAALKDALAQAPLYAVPKWKNEVQ